MWPRYIVLSLLLLGCSSREEGKQKANPVVEIEFEKNHGDLSDESKMKITQILNESQKKGVIKKIKAITWGDQIYPSVYGKGIASKESELALKRNVSLIHYLEELIPQNDLNMEFLSMAERNSALNNFMEGESEATRRSLKSKGIPNTDTTVKVPGKASKSIVILIMEE